MPSVADAICQTLKAYGTEYFFCLTGGDHALWIALDNAGIEVVLCRSEHAAVYAADGYARASGKPGYVYGQYGPGVANVVAGLNAGVVTFDASVAGIGGCPFAPKASGNICTEDTVHMLHEMGYTTGIDLDQLIEVARLAQDMLGGELPGQVMKAGPRWQLHAA